jgi:hypothetical protein
MSDKEQAVMQLDHWIDHWQKELMQEPVPFPKEMSVANLLEAAKQWKQRLLDS